MSFLASCFVLELPAPSLHNYACSRTLECKRGGAVHSGSGLPHLDDGVRVTGGPRRLATQASATDGWHSSPKNTGDNTKETEPCGCDHRFGRLLYSWADDGAAQKRGKLAESGGGSSNLTSPNVKRRPCRGWRKSSATRSSRLMPLAAAGKCLALRPAPLLDLRTTTVSRRARSSYRRLF